MESVDTSYIPEPENTLRPKGKSAKPVIFMILAVILGGIPDFSNYIISPFREFLSEWTATFPDGSVEYVISYVVSSSAGVILNFLLKAVPVIAVFLLAYFLYKNIKKTIRFFGSLFLATALVNIIKTVLYDIIRFVYDIIASYYAYTFGSESTDMYNEKINELSGYETDTRLAVTILSLIIVVVLGVLVFLVFDGRIKRRKKEKTESPSTPLKSGKKKFGLPEVFMLLSLILSQGVIRLVLYFFGYLAIMVDNILYPVIVVKFVGYENDEYHLFWQVVLKTISNALSNIVMITEAVLIFAVIVLFAVLAYRKMKGTALFLGVVFVATKIAWLFVEGPLIGIQSIITSAFYAVIGYLADTMVIDSQASSVAIAVYGTLSTIADIVVIVLGAAVITVSGVLVLMAVNGKLRKKAALPSENQ